MFIVFQIHKAKIKCLSSRYKTFKTIKWQNTIIYIICPFVSFINTLNNMYGILTFSLFFKIILGGKQDDEVNNSLCSCLLKWADRHWVQTQSSRHSFIIGKPMTCNPFGLADNDWQCSSTESPSAEEIKSTCAVKKARVCHFPPITQWWLIPPEKTQIPLFYNWSSQTPRAH